MSLTYSDFPYYIHGNGNPIFNELDDHRAFISALPREFRVIHESKVPLLQNVEEKCQDFVIIAEFSELEGPTPLVTIPSSAKSKTDIDLANFAVHLMSTDYQVNLMGQFKICEDTQVLRKNVFKNVHVFMQYFTLYDIKARGFVRPFCFGYVSKDHVKLDKKLDLLIRDFDKMTKVLKYANRKWFSGELEAYLRKLRVAKDNFIETGGSSRDGIFTFTEIDPDIVTLEQIAHQFSEIENILRTVQNFDSRGLDEPLSALSAYLSTLPEDSPLTSLLETFEIPIYPDETLVEINLPLVHPLKPKGEPLRPLTTLGQLGTVHLVTQLIKLYGEHRVDLLFSTMDELTTDFNRHCQSQQGKKQKKQNDDKPQEGDKEKENKWEDPALITILDKLHNYTPELLQDNKSSGGSSSYHTVSEQEESEIMPLPPSSPQTSESNEGSSAKTSPNSKAESVSPQSAAIRQSISSMSSDGALSTTTASGLLQMESSLAPSECVERVVCQPWHHYAQSPLSRGTPGYGILKFFRNYPKIAAHIFYSVLIGRPILLCGSEEHKGRVSRIINALIPLVPSKDKSWSVLRWHRGIIVQSHVQRFKLIGLCIPERLNVHDMIHPRDQNYVTIFSINSKTILGPAYSGNFLKSLLDAETSVAKFHQSDLSLLSYLGGIMAEVQTKVYMAKCQEEKKGKINFKDLSLQSSDIDIVRHLSSLISNPDMALDVL